MLRIRKLPQAGCEMKKQDFRSLSTEAKEDIRRRAVFAVRQEGVSPEAIVESWGVTRSALYGWLRRYDNDGLEGLATVKNKGREPTLNASEKKVLEKSICKYTPDHFGLGVVLWTRELVSAYIQQRFGKVLGIHAVGKMLARMGITFQKPLRRAYEQDEKAVEKWLKEDFPAIDESAKKRRSSLLFADEATVRSDHQSGKTWGKRGKTPVVRTSGARHSVNVISSVSRRGDLRFMLFEGRLNGEGFVLFLKRLMKGRHRPVDLVVDNSSVHKNRVVKEYVDSLKGKLRLHFLPPYSPELNPDEFVWNDLKNHGVNLMALT